MATYRFPRGTPVRVQMHKWVVRPHWTFPAVYLGADDHGEWLGFPAGSRFTRPGATYVAPVDQVGLVPSGVTEVERAALATFHAPGGEVSAYVDMATPPRWSGTVLSAVDLDLDVVRGTTGRVWVDDEDEFARHRVTLAYPEEVVRLACASCDRVQALVAAGRAPYDLGTAAAWFAVLTELLVSPT